MLHQPELSPVPGKDQYMLLEDYPVKYGDIYIVVPQYFIYDGASVPRFGWNLTYTPFHPDVMAPALAHDWLYLNHQVGRKMADQIFYDLLIRNGAKSGKSKLMHQAVRIGGGGHWERGPKEIETLRVLYILAKPSENFDTYHFPLEVINVSNSDSATN